MQDTATIRYLTKPNKIWHLRIHGTVLVLLTVGPSVSSYNLTSSEPWPFLLQIYWKWNRLVDVWFHASDFEHSQWGRFLLTQYSRFVWCILGFRNFCLYNQPGTSTTWRHTQPESPATIPPFLHIYTAKRDTFHTGLRFESRLRNFTIKFQSQTGSYREELT